MENSKIELTSENVYNIFFDCLLNDDEECDYKEVEVVSSVFRFNKEKLQNYETDIIDLIGQLPNMDSEISFLELCKRSDNAKWGGYVDVEHLVSLGLATNNLVYFVPKEMWPSLPFGMPYILKNEKELRMVKR